MKVINIHKYKIFFMEITNYRLFGSDFCELADLISLTVPYFLAICGLVYRAKSKLSPRLRI